MSIPALVPRHDDGPSIACLAFRPAGGHGALVGHGDFHLPRVRMRLLNCAVFDTGQARWVGLPSAPQLDADRRARTGSDGKTIYRPCLEFDDPQLARAFSDAAIDALLRYRPDAFGG
ncbi:MAG TPA: hypothetical protein VNS34_27005 [Rhizobiaceae bacterium]|nr:hypothetical protein [Rhizobiaceae bacterium]